MEPLEQILDEHGDALFAFLLQLTRSEPDARDLFQDLCRRLVQDPGLLDHARDRRAFLLQAARNQFIDLTRRRGTRTAAHERLLATVEPAGLFEPSPDPDEAAFRQALDDALGQLPEEQRTVVHLKLWEGLTFDAIAQLLGLSPNTAASRYRYGVGKLRILLQPLYDELQAP